MEGTPPPVPGEPPRQPAREVPVDEDARPATVGQLRSLRRWLVVAGAWAAAATAIAVIALIAANEDDSAEADKRTAQTASQVAEIQRDLNERMDGIEERIDGLPQSEDVSDLDNRLTRIENSAGRTSDQLEELTGQVSDLEQQVEALEQAADGRAGPRDDSVRARRAPTGGALRMIGWTIGRLRVLRPEGPIPVLFTDGASGWTPLKTSSVRRRPSRRLPRNGPSTGLSGRTPPGSRKNCHSTLDHLLSLVRALKQTERPGSVLEEVLGILGAVL